MSKKLIGSLKQMLALFLCVTIIAQILPARVHADEVINTSDMTASEQEFFDAIGEDTTKRTADTKHFRMGDGSYTVVKYDTAVHYQDSAGVWQDIDNTFTTFDNSNNETMQTSTDAVTAGYVNRSNRVEVLFAQNLTKGTIYQYSDGDYKIVMGLMPEGDSVTPIQPGLEVMGEGEASQTATENSGSIEIEPIEGEYSTATASVMADTEAASMTFETKLEELYTLNDVQSGIEYAEVYPGVSLRYEVIGTGVKETIIVNEPAESYEYTFLLTLDGLQARLEEDGSISLYDPTITDTEEAVKYVIPEPFMKDSSFAHESPNVHYELGEMNAKGEIELTVAADAEWINSKETVFPVYIDPAVVEKYYVNSFDTYVVEDEPYSDYYASDSLYAGWSGMTGLHRIYWKYDPLPDIPTASIVVNAQIIMYQFIDGYSAYSGSETMYLGVREITEAWSLDPYFYWALQPEFADEVLDYKEISSATNGTHVSLDITPLVQGWYAGTKANNGIMIAPVVEYGDGDTTTTRAAVGFASCNWGGTIQPMIAVQYRDAKGIEDYWTYHTQSVGDAGTGYINDFTGNLTFVHSDMSSIGGVLPIHAEHVYTGYLARAYYNKYNTLTSDFEYMIIGAGWKLGSQETVVTTTISGVQYYVHSDRDGTEHYYYNQDSDAAYESEDGLKYEITKNSDGSFTMTDEYGGSKTFNSEGRMTKIQDVNGNQKLYNYNSTDQLINIQEKNNGGTTRTIMTFSYYNNFLTGMTDGLDSSDTVTYYYSNGPTGTTLYSGTGLSALDKNGITSVGYLRKIVHSKGGTTTFEYNSDGYLIQVRDEETKGRLFYEYSSTGSVEGQVSKVTEYGYNFSNNAQVQGQSMGITYSGHKTTQFRTSGLDDVYGNSDDLVTTYVMDHFGRTVCQYTTKVNSTNIYAASNAAYSNGTDSFKTKHSVTQSATTGGWATSGSSVDAAGVNNDLGNGEFASTASWSFSTGATASGGQLVIDGSHLGARNANQTITFNAPATQTYILSGWAKADAVPKEKEDSNRKFELRAEITYSDNTKEIQTVVFNTDVTEWQFASGGIVPKETSKTVKSIKIYCAFDYQPNTAYFDHIRLTTEPSPTYKYDSDGKLTNITAEDGTSQGLVYSGVDLTSESLPNGDKYTYTYKTDSNGKSTHQVATVTDKNGVKASYNYDAYGNMTQTVISASGMTSTVSAKAAYTSDGRFLSTITDALGHTVTYGTNTSTGLQTYVQDPAGNWISYSYNSDEYLTNAWMDTDKDSVMDSTEAGVIYGYLYDRLSTIQTRSSKYYYSYDPYSGVSSIGVGSASGSSAAYTLRSYTYNGYGGKLNAMTFGNGTKESYTYDAVDRLISIAYGSSVKYQYEYNDDNQLSLVWDKYNNIKTELVYDRIGRLATATTKYLNSDGSVKETMTTGYVYDNAGRLDSLTYTIGSTTMTYDAAYKTNSDLISTFVMPNATIHYSYDALQRMTDQRIKNSSGTVLGGQSYSYQAGSGTNATSTIVNRVTMDKSGNYFDYTYDSRGNITQIKKNGSIVAAYTYDAQNQLLSETYGGKTWNYTYDKAGNILTVSDGTTTNNYGYSTSWGDLLTSYKGTTITYDNAGNPLSYYNGKNYNFTWTEGNRLASATVNNTTTSYTYTEGGIRNSKTVGGVKTQYYLDGSRIVRENRNGTIIDYYYDDLGNVVGFKYNNNYYYYGRNLQGDVVELYCNGSLVGQYEYDAWGKVLAVKNGSGATITSSSDPAMVNPFRYRGYYYDSETGLYYLNSRYYDPEIGRFISADAPTYLGVGTTLVHYNLFSYCNNNPILYVDKSGCAPYACTYFIGDSGSCYILDQYECAYADWVLGGSTVGEKGCGLIAIYNVMITLGNPQNFYDVYRYFTSNAVWVEKLQTKSVSIDMVTKYFWDQGYTAFIIPFHNDFYATVGDANIILYSALTRNKENKLKSYGHYVELCLENDGTYTVRNCPGQEQILSPTKYAYKGSRYFAWNIIIYKDFFETVL